MILTDESGQRWSVETGSHSHFFSSDGLISGTLSLRLVAGPSGINHPTGDLRQDRLTGTPEPRRDHPQELLELLASLSRRNPDRVAEILAADEGLGWKEQELGLSLDLAFALELLAPDREAIARFPSGFSHLLAWHASVLASHRTPSGGPSNPERRGE